MMVRVGGGWDTLEHFLSRHEPCQVRLVTQGRRGDVLPVALTPPHSDSPDRKHRPSISPASSKASSLGGTISPTDSKASSISGKISPIDAKHGKSPRSYSRTDSGKSSPLHEASVMRTSTPTKLAAMRNIKSALTLPLKTSLDAVDGARSQKTPTPRNRKQSAPSVTSYSTPNTPTTKTAKTPTTENRKSLTGSSISNVTKKSRSMSLATVQKTDDKKQFCGTDRLNNAARNKSASVTNTPTKESVISNARKARSQSVVSTPDKDTKKAFCGTDKLNSYAKKTRSMSLASPVALRPMKKSISVMSPGAMTQAAIEESIRLSLAASIADTTSPNKPFLHIKAKYRSPPPREVPPR